MSYTVWCHCVSAVKIPHFLLASKLYDSYILKFSSYSDCFKMQHIKGRAWQFDRLKLYISVIECSVLKYKITFQFLNYNEKAPHIKWKPMYIIYPIASEMKWRYHLWTVTYLSNSFLRFTMPGNVQFNNLSHALRNNYYVVNHTWVGTYSNSNLQTIRRKSGVLRIWARHAAIFWPWYSFWSHSPGSWQWNALKVGYLLLSHV